MAKANPLLEWKFIDGKPRDFWANELKYVEKYVTANQGQLRKIDINARAGFPSGVICSSGPAAAKESGEPKAMATIQLPEWVDGGMRVPHLHYNGDIYVLTKEQWKQFSGQILKGFSKKLADTSTVSFEQLMELSDTMGSIV
jgi:hypothetical protein